MSDDAMTLSEKLALLQEQLQQVWKTINEKFVQPLCHWVRSICLRITEAFRGVAILSDRKHRPHSRNSRVQAVQAKRARLMLPPSGKYAGMTRRASYALAYARMSK